MEESSKLKKRSDGHGVSSDNIRTSALDRLRAAKASLEEQKGKSASARTYKAHTMSSADRSEYFQLRSQMTAAAGSPDQDPAPRLQPQRSSDFLRRLREEKLGWQSGDSPQAAADGQGRAAADTPSPAAPAPRSPEATGPVSGSGSGVGSFFREERKRLQESGGSRAGSGSLVRQSSTPAAAAAAADASVLDVLQAGTVELQSSSEKTNSPSISTSPALLKVSPWLSAKEQKRSLSSIKRTKDEKLKALEQLQSQLQQKRADINAQKEKQQHNDELLAKMVSKSIIIAPVVARGSRLVGKSIIVPRAEDAAQPKAASPPLASKLATSAGGGPRAPAPQLTVTALEDEPAKGEGEKAKEEKAKEKEKKAKSKVKELKKKKQEEKMMDDMERQLLRESKKMDEEKKNIQIDNQLSTFLTSLLTLESGFRTVEKEKIEALKKLDAADREREYLGTFLVCLLENVKRVHAGMQDVIQAHSAEAASESSATSLLADVMQRQQEMEEIVSATTSFLGSATLSSTASDQFQSSSALTSSSSSSAALPSLSSFSSFASISDLRTSLSVPAVVEQPPAAAAPPATIHEQAPAPPVAPPAATSSTPPPPPPPAAEVPLPPSSPAAAPTSGGGESRGAVLAQIRTGGFDLKKVERRPPAPPPPSTAGNLFQSLQDTLVAAMNVRKLAMQGGDDDDPDDNEWD